MNKEIEELKWILRVERDEAECYIDSMKKEIEALKEKLVKQQQEILQLKLKLSSYENV